MLTFRLVFFGIAFLVVTGEVVGHFLGKYEKQRQLEFLIDVPQGRLDVLPIHHKDMKESVNLSPCHWNVYTWPILGVPPGWTVKVNQFNRTMLYSEAYFPTTGWVSRDDKPTGTPRCVRICHRHTKGLGPKANLVWYRPDGNYTQPPKSVPACSVEQKYASLRTATIGDLPPFTLEPGQTTPGILEFKNFSLRWEFEGNDRPTQVLHRRVAHGQFMDGCSPKADALAFRQPVGSLAPVTVKVKRVAGRHATKGSCPDNLLPANIRKRLRVPSHRDYSQERRKRAEQERQRRLQERARRQREAELREHQRLQEEEYGRSGRKQDQPGNRSLCGWKGDVWDCADPPAEPEHEVDGLMDLLNRLPNQ